MWGLLRLYGEIGLAMRGAKAWRWAGTSWRSWQAYLVDDVDLSLSHLFERDPSSRDEAGGRMPSEPRAEWRGVSTIALFALLIRLSYGGRQALRSSPDRSVVLSLLTSILKAWLGGRMLTFTLFLSKKPVWSPPRLPESSENFAAGPASCTCLAVSDGNISLKPLLDARSPDLVELQKLVKPIVLGPLREASIQDLFEALTMKRIERGVLWLWMQLIWFCGRVGDTHTKGHLEFLAETTMCDMNRASAHKAIFQYRSGFMRACEAARVVHIALDGSTVGKKPFVFSVLALPSGIGGVGSPVVHRGLKQLAPLHTWAPYYGAGLSVLRRLGPL